MECIHVYSVCVCFFRDLFSSFCLLSHSNLFSVHLFFVFCCTLCGCLVRFTFFIRIKKGFSKLAEKYFYALLFFKRLSRFFFFKPHQKRIFFDVRSRICSLLLFVKWNGKWQKRNDFFPLIDATDRNFSLKFLHEFLCYFPRYTKWFLVYKLPFISAALFVRFACLFA